MTTPSKVFNRSALKALTLERAARMGRTRFKRVAESWLAETEEEGLAFLTRRLDEKIHRHPSVGITLK